MSKSTTAALAPFLDQLASDAPTPGGGAAAAVTAAQGVALLSMVLNVTFKKDRAALATEGLNNTHANLEAARDRFLTLADADAEAFKEVMTAYSLPKSNDVEKATRMAAIEGALHAATEVPLQLLREIAGLATPAATVVERGSKQIISDAGIALVLLKAAAKASKYNVLINLKLMKEEAYKDEVAAEMKRLLQHIKQEDKMLRSLVDGKF